MCGILIIDQKNYSICVAKSSFPMLTKVTLVDKDCMVDKFSAQTLKPTLQLFLLLGSHAVDGDKPPSSIRSEMATGRN